MGGLPCLANKSFEASAMRAWTVVSPSAASSLSAGPASRAATAGRGFQGLISGLVAAT
jgi:hypothetical protein